MKFIVIFFLLISLLNSCVPYVLRKRLSFCYDGKNTGIDSLINVDGYFKITVIEERNERYTTKGQWSHKVDTSNTNLMFFRDGIFLYEFFDKNIPKYFEEIIQNPKGKEAYWFYRAFYWGRYIICGDTIKAQCINHPAPLAPTWIAFESWFKVVNKNTIKLVARRKLYYDKTNQNESEMDLVFFSGTQCKIATFIPMQVCPSSDCWLKKEKWFWCKVALNDKR